MSNELRERIESDPSYSTLSTDLAAAEATTLVATAEGTHRTNRTVEYEVRVTAEDERVATFRGRVYRL